MVLGIGAPTNGCVVGVDGKEDAVGSPMPPIVGTDCIKEVGKTAVAEAETAANVVVLGKLDTIVELPIEANDVVPPLVICWICPMCCPVGTLGRGTAVEAA